ncbi:MAG: orotidine 5'-phosphate decarboxylase [Bacteroidota bacterium]|nr:orotidine 5'-phosphate decarboxylase [Bacteroidota bacterium]
MRPVVQISLDLTDAHEALRVAVMALRAGVDWLEVGTPLLLHEGVKAIQVLRAVFARVPIVADLKTMDGGYQETRMMAEAGATHVVVMGRAHDETLRRVVRAARECEVKVMGDNLACPDKVQAARRLEDFGCNYVIHHIGYDERNGIGERGGVPPNPLDELHAVIEAVDVPVSAIGGLSVADAVQACRMGAPVVGIGAPLAIDSEEFKRAGGDVETILREVCIQVHALVLP